MSREPSRAPADAARPAAQRSCGSVFDSHMPDGVESAPMTRSARDRRRFLQFLAASPLFAAAWAPAVVALLAGTTLLCYTEDG